MQKPSGEGVQKKPGGEWVQKPSGVLAGSALAGETRCGRSPRRSRSRSRGNERGGGARGGAGGGGSCALHSPLLLGIFLTLTSLLKLTLLASEEASVWSERRESERSEDRRPGRSRQGCGRPQVHRREDRLTEAGPGWVRTKMKIEIRNFEFRIPTPCLTSVSR